MPRPTETALLTLLALLAFAFNSILTRMGQGARAMDAASFVTVRLAAGRSCWRRRCGRGRCRAELT